QRVHGDAGEQVDVLRARLVPHAGSLAADQQTLRLPQCGEDRRFVVRAPPARVGHHPCALRVSHAWPPIESSSASGSALTIVPIPSVVNTSSRIEWATRPSTMCAWPTPASTASSAAVILGIMPES